MAQQIINPGTGVNTGTGDTLPTMTSKINANFTELYGSGAALNINNQTGTTYSLAATDAPGPSYLGIITMNNAAANTVTVPANSSVPFPIATQMQVIQLGAGQTAIAAAAGVTVSTPSSLTARVQYSTLVLTQIATNVWVLGGDMT